MRYIKTAKAKKPNGWVCHEFGKSPLSKKPIERPSPQPGQKSNPKLKRGQMLQ